ncbi:MAG: DUF5710 domain-containing protein, partial [Candidatus Adiutrix sp.]|nr:DUF5710 domain-containing protein [Candidatus Adiutrix sp.]
MPNEKTNPRQEIVDRFLSSLKNGDSPFAYPFEAGDITPPISGLTGKGYSGINRLILTERGESDPRWLTKKQAEAQGYQVKDFAPPRRLVFWEYTQEVPVYNPDGSPRLNNIGNQVLETVRRDRPLMRTFAVYRARDLMTLDGQELPPYEPPTVQNDPLDRVSAILANSGAIIRHEASPYAGTYQSQTDTIILPEKELVYEEAYYSLALKELVSWTGQTHRLGWRAGLVSGEQQVQAHLQETLAGAMLAQDLDIKFDPDANSRIIGHWIQVLEKDPEIFFRAAVQADNIRLYITSLERTQVQDLEDRRRERSAPEYYSQGFRPAGPEDKPEQGAWIRTFDEAQATVFAVVSGHDDSVVSTFDNREASVTEAQALNLGVKPSFKYSSDTMPLRVPFEEKDMVKALGATWDRHNKAWCARPGVELSKLGRWLSAQDLNNPGMVEPDLNDRLALEVPYSQRQEAKDLGAFFDNRKGAWVTSINNKNLDEITKKFPPRRYLETAPEQKPDLAAVPEIAIERVILAVPYEEKHLAKAAGATWNRDEKVWLAEPGTDLAKLSQWIPEREPEPEKVLAAAEELATVLKENGFQLDGLPNMDGKIYRVPVEGGKAGAKDGAYYAAMNNDRPNGWLKNHRSGEYRAWTYTGQELTVIGKEAQKAQAAARRLARDDKAENLSMAKWAIGLDVAKEFAAQIDGLTPTAELLKNPFLEVAGINAVGGVRRDDDGNLMVPG